MENLSFIGNNSSDAFANVSSANGSFLATELHVIGGICLVGFPGNLLTFIVLLRERCKSGTMVLLMALAAVDGALIFLMFINFPVAYYDIWPHSVANILDPVASGTFYVVQLMSVWIVCYVCVERFVAICYPYKSVTFCTTGNAKRALAGIFIGSLILNAPTLSDVIMKKGKIEKSAVGAKVIEIFGSVIMPCLLFFIPCVLLIFTNIGLAFGINRAKLRHNTFAKDAQTKEQGHSIAAALNIVAVVTAFLMTQLPNAGIFLWIWVLSSRSQTQAEWMTRLTCIRFILIALNSSVNILVYCFFYRRFRRGIVQLCCCRRHAPKQSQFRSTSKAGARSTLLVHANLSYRKAS